MLYLCLALEQFSCNEEKIFWTLAFFEDGWCHDLPQRLSHYYFYFILFSFIFEYCFSFVFLFF